MDRSNVAQQVAVLERRSRWQMRAIIGLLIAFLLNASPAFTSKWFHRLLPPKLTAISSPSGASEVNAVLPDVSSHRARALRRGQSGRNFLDKMLSRDNEVLRSSKQAQQQVVDVLATRQLQIVNAAGQVVAVIGADEGGDGVLAIGRSDGTSAVELSVDEVGDGLVLATGASESFGALSSDGVGVLRGSDSSVRAAFLGVDDEGNGVVTTLSTAGTLALLGTGNDGAGVIVGGGSESSASAAFLGVDDEGNGVVTTLSTAGTLALLGTGNDGAGVIVGGGSESNGRAAFLGVDDAGNGVVTTFGTAGSFATLGVDEDGDAFVGVTKNGVAASVLGVDERGHGVLGILNASGRPIAAMAADASGNGALGIDGGKFRAFVDASGNGVAETRGRTQNLLWSSESDSGDGGGGTSSGLQGDFDNNGVVDFADFLVFARNFGKTSG